MKKELLANAKRIVIKIGSRILVDTENKGVNKAFIEKFAESVAILEKAGKEVVVVTSGAVGEGMARLGYTQKPENIADKQACAAVGQIDLMHAYRNAFEKENLVVGQILLSAEDFRQKNRSTNLQNTLNSMLYRKVIPIINENDSVAVEEIKVGDNDKLSSSVAIFWKADLLILFTDEDGLFDSNPKTNPNAKLIDFVEEVTEEILSLAGKGENGSAISTGGMHSKLEAVQAATLAGCSAFLANGTKLFPHQVLFEDVIGTMFVSKIV